MVAGEKTDNLHRRLTSVFRRGPQLLIFLPLRGEGEGREAAVGREDMVRLEGEAGKAEPGLTAHAIKVAREQADRVDAEAQQARAVMAPMAAMVAMAEMGKTFLSLIPLLTMRIIFKHP